VPEEELTKTIYKNIFGFTRLRKPLQTGVTNMIAHVIKKQKQFDYNYYLCKNCPLPENWPERKKQYLIDAKNNKRAQVY
jgi:hypothetical protein